MRAQERESQFMVTFIVDVRVVNDEVGRLVVA